MGILDGMKIVEGEGAVLRKVNLGHPIVTNEGYATRLFPNYFGQDLFQCSGAFEVWRDA